MAFRKAVLGCFWAQIRVCGKVIHKMGITTGNGEQGTGNRKRPGIGNRESEFGTRYPATDMPLVPRPAPYPLMPVMAMPRMKVFIAAKKRIIRGRLKTVEAAISRCHGVPPCSDWNAWSDRLSVNCDGCRR